MGGDVHLPFPPTMNPASTACNSLQRIAVVFFLSLPCSVSCCTLILFYLSILFLFSSLHLHHNCYFYYFPPLPRLFTLLFHQDAPYLLLVTFAFSSPLGVFSDPSSYFPALSINWPRCHPAPLAIWPIQAPVRSVHFSFLPVENAIAKRTNFL